MPFSLDLPLRWKAAGWKVKIRDRERLEPPHVTVLHGPDEWRIGLRDGRFLVPPGGAWSELPAGVRRAVREGWMRLREAWDAANPQNPVGGDRG